MTKWQAVTDGIVRHVFADMQDPKNRGPAFDAATYDIGDWVLGTGMINFRRMPAPAVKAKMRQRAVALWAELWAAKGGA